METPQLYEPLQRILKEELAGGNEIETVNRDGWTKVDVVVYLKRPFTRRYATEAEGISFYRNTDPHYILGESYTAAEARHSIEAPTEAKK